MRRLIDTGVDIEHIYENEPETMREGGFTPLIRAAGHGHIDVAVELMKSKVDVNKGNLNGVTPLNFAAWAGSTEVKAKLIQAKADVNLTDEVGTTPLI